MPLHLFAGIRVRDFHAARDWYERLLGEPTFYPHATEAVWTLAHDRSVYVVEHPHGAGNSVVTIFLGVGKLIYRDPDGNEVGFGGAFDAGPEA